MNLATSMTLVAKEPARDRAILSLIYGSGIRLSEAHGIDFDDVEFATKRVIAFRAEGTQFASGNMPAPGGMPGGRLVV